MIIIITGTPGTGKTSLAKALATDINHTYIDVNKVIDENKLIESFDKELQTNIIDEKKLAKILTKTIKENKDLIIDSHLAHYIPKKQVDHCIVTKCSIKMLKKRLEKRKYPKAKIQENMDCEIFDVCLTEAIESGYNPIILDTTKSTLKQLITIIKNETNNN
jgi:adenylate kinase